MLKGSIDYPKITGAQKLWLTENNDYPKISYYLSEAPRDIRIATKEHKTIGTSLLVWSFKNQAAINIGIKQKVNEMHKRPRIVIKGVTNNTTITMIKLIRNEQAR